MCKVLVDFRGLSKPDPAIMAKRDEKVKEIIKQLGHKYLLARPMPRIL